MPSVVLELQQKSMLDQVSISELLRMTLVVAHKLSVSEFSLWAQQELDGYTRIVSDPVPQYRHVHGQLWARGQTATEYVPVETFSELTNVAETHIEKTSIPQLELLLSENKDKVFRRDFSAEALNKLNEIGYGEQFALYVHRAEFHLILQTIRQHILTWTLQLTDEGILGQGIQFSEQEKRVAQEHHEHLTINAPGGRIQIQRDTTHSTQTMEIHGLDIQQLQTLTEQIRTHLEQTGLEEEEQSEALREIHTLTEQVQSGSPQPGVISKSLTIIKRILENASSSVVATGLLALIDKFSH
ncbi:hypothetical protein [Alicyclobacillus fodiniaquatilis]